MVGITASALAPLPLAAMQQASGSYQSGIVLFSVVPLVCIIILAQFKRI
jgi:MFS-type transporter involved in bile tolerance (Atg22 family)